MPPLLSLRFRLPQQARQKKRKKDYALGRGLREPAGEPARAVRLAAAGRGRHAGLPPGAWRQPAARGPPLHWRLLAPQPQRWWPPGPGEQLRAGTAGTRPRRRRLLRRQAAAAAAAVGRVRGAVRRGPPGHRCQSNCVSRWRERGATKHSGRGRAPKPSPRSMAANSVQMGFSTQRRAGRGRRQSPGWVAWGFHVGRWRAAVAELPRQASGGGLPPSKAWQAASTLPACLPGYGISHRLPGQPPWRLGGKALVLTRAGSRAAAAQRGKCKRCGCGLQQLRVDGGGENAKM